jgi:hypothetical protein
MQCQRSFHLLERNDLQRVQSAAFHSKMFSLYFASIRGGESE